MRGGAVRHLLVLASLGRADVKASRAPLAGRRAGAPLRQIVVETDRFVISGPGILAGFQKLCHEAASLGQPWHLLGRPVFAAFSFSFAAAIQTALLASNLFVSLSQATFQLSHR